MEHTLGNRIAENRKRLGLTQEALAEKLGVTAQAVSKWENDQSCPDINTLPKLADIFGISIDTLLGRENVEVHDAEVVEDSEAKEEEKGNWEFHWEGGRNGSIFFAIFVILTGGLMILSKTMELDVSLWSLAWPSFLLCFGIHSLTKRFSFSGILSTLIGGYFIVDNLGVWELNFSSQLIFPGIVVLFGISLLVDALKKPRKPKFRFSHKGVHARNGKSRNSFNCENDTFACEQAFGEDSRYIDLPQLRLGLINCSFGELDVDLSGCETVAPDCRIQANCAFGEVTLLVPKRFRVEADSCTSFASFEFSGQPDQVPLGLIRLDADVSFGEILVKYV